MNEEESLKEIRDRHKNRLALSDEDVDFLLRLIKEKDIWIEHLERQNSNMVYSFHKYPQKKRNYILNGSLVSSRNFT